MVIHGRLSFLKISKNDPEVFRIQHVLETHLCNLHTSSHICQYLPIFAIMTQASRENYRLWAERFVIGAAAAQRLHTELQGRELESMREAFLRNEMDKELAAAVQPAMAGPYWHATKSAIQAGHSVDFCRQNTCFSTPARFIAPLLANAMVGHPVGQILDPAHNNKKYLVHPCAIGLQNVFWRHDATCFRQL